ncbi:hypothetical protein FPY71_14860 [Aureimonas fodinaquatilis]|uniref:Uncharacterized protein n=1 Tax=Aureimonas fodinaquatilis TaxID=2565783 RepID=A0A5B0DX43_9HYPH|nr:hypothetical protein [Aureimonas fodinaquatilis]KAA0969789.1 hypothetical protein FPY71_14860 [Aureimonas fodinaquatilis]
MNFVRPADPPLHVPIADDEIRQQLSRVLSSRAFDAPDRAQKFLSYVIEETLQGRADRIKAYSIALEVFGRDASFDAQNDPAVRIEAGRVRRALEHYYLLEGQQDPILITIPKGGYVPAFTRFHELKAMTSELNPRRPPLVQGTARTAGMMSAAALLIGAGLWVVFSSSIVPTFRASEPDIALKAVPPIPTVIVAPFEDITGTQSSSLFARGLTDELIGQMARFKEIVILAGDRSGSAMTEPGHGSELPLYGLEGRVRLDDNRLRFSARLIDRSSKAIIWTKSYDAALGRRELLDIETEFAGEVATALAQPYGVIFQATASELVKSQVKGAQAYACTLSYYGYRSDLNRQTHTSVQDCLKQVVIDYPGYATAWALLSLTYLDELRFRYRLESSGPPPIDLAVEAADRAAELDPGNVRALQAEMLAKFFSGDVKNALYIGERAYAINPNDTEFTAEYGFRLALSGEWERGCELISLSIDRNPGPMEYFQSAMAICAYIGGDYAEAERWARTSNLSGNPIYHLIMIAIYGQRGKMLEAQVELGWLELNAPQYLEDTRKEVTSRILRDEDQEHFIAGLRKAGVYVSAVPSPRAEDSLVDLNPPRG